MATRPGASAPSHLRPYRPPYRPWRRSNYSISAMGAFCGAIMLLFAAGCAQEPTNVPLPMTPPQDRATAPVVRRPIPPTPIPAPPEVPPRAFVPAPEPSIVLPPNAQYVCVSGAGDQRQQTAIEFSPNVAALCAKHPEMGPCQYERNACRRSGGRVFAAEGKEITMATEAEYDKRVIRIRLKSN